MAIEVNLDDHTGNVSHQAKMDENAEVAQLISAIVSSLRLPIVDDIGRPVIYRLSYRDRLLGDSETLATAEVQPRDTLTIVPEMMATPTNSDLSDILRNTMKLADAIDILYAKSVAQELHVLIERKELPARLGEGKAEEIESGEGKAEEIESGEGKAEEIESGEGKTEEIESGEDKEGEDPCLEPSGVPSGLSIQNVFQAHKKLVTNIAWSRSGTMLASSSGTGIIYLWDVQTNKPRSLIGHAQSSSSLAWSPNGEILASGSSDQSIRLWAIDEGKDFVTFFANEKGEKNENSTATIRIGLDQRKITAKEPDEGIPTNIAWSPRSSLLAVTTKEEIAIWDVNYTSPPRDRSNEKRSENRERLKRHHTFKEHTHDINNVVWSPDGKKLVSCASYQDIIIWDVQTLQHQTLSGHVGDVNSVVWSPLGKMLASCSHDYTVRIWNPEDGQEKRILQGHTKIVRGVSFSYDERILASQDEGGTILFWRTDTWQQVATLIGSPPNGWMTNFAFHPHEPLLAIICKQVIQLWNVDIGILASSVPSTSDPNVSATQYTSAKVVLVGKSGVGKSALGLRLIGQPFTLTETTNTLDVLTFYSKEILLDERQQVLREIFLWDLAGQSGYRLIHQLRLRKAILAMIVFDKGEENFSREILYWDRALRQAQKFEHDPPLPLKKFLIAGRVDDYDKNGDDQKLIESLRDQFNFDHFFQTSAKKDWNISELINAIHQNIAWDKLPIVSSILFVQNMRVVLQKQRKAAKVLLTIEELSKELRKTLSEYQIIDEKYDHNFNLCIIAAEAQGLVRKLSYGDLVLLQPELLDAYAFALIKAVKAQSDGLGCIAEKQVLEGEFPIDEKWRLKKEDEKLLLIAMIEELMQCEIALRENTEEKGVQLIFPSQCTNKYPNRRDLDKKTIVFHFEGPVSNIYAALIVRLAYSGMFKKDGLWENVAAYKTPTGRICRVFLKNDGEGHAELNIFFEDMEDEIDKKDRDDFDLFIQLDLRRRKIDFQRERIYTCPKCNEAVSQLAVEKLRSLEKYETECTVCELDNITVLIDLSDGERQLSSQRPLVEFENYIVENYIVVKEMHDMADSRQEQQKLAVSLQGKVVADDYDVLLCYNEADIPIVIRIGEGLKRRGYLPWFYHTDIIPGRVKMQATQEQIEKMKAVAGFIGDEGFDTLSNMILDAAVEKSEKDPLFPIIPVLLPNESSQEHTGRSVPNIPHLLRGRQPVDFRRADPQDPKTKPDDFARAIRKLVQGITGKCYE